MESGDEKSFWVVCVFVLVLYPIVFVLGRGDLSVFQCW